jgi:hypothetical protein
MIDERPTADRTLIARLTGTARRLAGWRELAEGEEAAAVAELRQLAAGRADLLAEVAGLGLGAAEGKGDVYKARAEAEAELCRLAGADPEAIPAWIQEGRRRKAPAGMPPPSGGRRLGHCR